MHKAGDTEVVELRKTHASFFLILIAEHIFLVEIELYNFITCYFHLALCHKYFLPVIIELFIFYCF